MGKKYVFDFDSTLTSVEALDVLAEITLENNPKKDEIIQNLNWDAWTLESAGPPNVLEMTQEKVTFAINLGDDYITLAGASSPDGAAAFKNYPR